jgi:hypothetical protein
VGTRLAGTWQIALSATDIFRRGEAELDVEVITDWRNVADVEL